jgi:hypothetical protein
VLPRTALPLAPPLPSIASAAAGAALFGNEPRRDFRRLQTLREWSHDDDSKEVFT